MYNQFSLCEFAYKGNKFTSVEQEYQYCKAKLVKDERTAALLLHLNIPSDIKDDTLHSFKKICILSENIIFHE